MIHAFTEEKPSEGDFYREYFFKQSGQRQRSYFWLSSMSLSGGTNISAHQHFPEGLQKKSLPHSGQTLLSFILFDFSELPIFPAG